MSIAQRRWHMLRGIRGPNKARASKRTVGINAQADRRRTRCFEVPRFRRPLSSCHCSSFENSENLIDALGLAHGSLQVEGLDVLPVLLEKRDKKVDSNVDIGEKLLLSHLNVANSSGEAESLLKLELDSGLDLISLVLQFLLVSKETRELAGLVETGTQETGNLLDEGI